MNRFISKYRALQLYLDGLTFVSFCNQCPVQQYGETSIHLPPNSSVALVPYLTVRMTMKRGIGFSLNSDKSEWNQGVRITWSPMCIYEIDSASKLYKIVFSTQPQLSHNRRNSIHLKFDLRNSNFVFWPLFFPRCLDNCCLRGRFKWAFKLNQNFVHLCRIARGISQHSGRTKMI